MADTTTAQHDGPQGAGALRGEDAARAAEAARSGRPPQGGGKEGGFFYGWWIVIGGLLIMATCYTIFVNCIPLFQSHMVADLGISVGQFNTGVSICTVVAVFASLVIGRLTDKCSARVLAAVTILTSSIVLVLFSFITELWQLYALCVIAGMVVVAGTRLLVSVVIANWFTLKRGLAVSIALAGSGGDVPRGRAAPLGGDVPQQTER